MVLVFNTCTWILRMKNRIPGKYLSTIFDGSRLDLNPRRGPGSFFHTLGIRRNKSEDDCDKALKSPPCLRDELICPYIEPIRDGLNKVSIIGAGMVGIACANAILFQKISSHVALIDAFPQRLRGEGHEFSHALRFLDDPQVEYDTDFCISSNSRVVIITTSGRQGKNETTQDLVRKNSEILKSIIQTLNDYSPNAIFLIVTNPVEIMTWLTWKVSGLPINRVLGTGTHLDSARFSYMLAKRLGLATRSVEAWVIGEQAQNQVPLWSGITVAGTQLRDILPNIGETTDEQNWLEIAKDVQTADAFIKCLKGYSNTAIGLAVADITKAILRNAQSIKAVSTLAKGHYGICDELFLSLPCSIGQNGVTGVVRQHLTEYERKRLEASAASVLKLQSTIKL